MSESNQDSAHTNPPSSAHDDAIVDEDIIDLENPGTQNKSSDANMTGNQEAIDTSSK